MIIYNPRRWRGFVVLTSCRGSSFFKAMPLPFLAAAFTLFIRQFPHFFGAPDRVPITSIRTVPDARPVRSAAGGECR